MSVKSKEEKRVLADRDYWVERAPPGFRLYGFTETHTASFFRPNGKVWYVTDTELADINHAYGRVLS